MHWVHWVYDLAFPSLCILVTRWQMRRSRLLSGASIWQDGYEEGFQDGHRQALVKAQILRGICE